MPDFKNTSPGDWAALKQRAKDMIENGATVRETCDALDLGYDTVHSWKTSDFEDRSRCLAPEQIEMLCKMYAAGVPRAEIGAVLGRSAVSITSSALTFATPEQKAARDKALGRAPRKPKGMHKPFTGSGIVPVHQSILVRTQANASAASQKSQEATTAKPGDPRTWNALWTNGAPWLNGAIPAYPARI